MAAPRYQKSTKPVKMVQPGKISLRDFELNVSAPPWSAFDDLLHCVSTVRSLLPLFFFNITPKIGYLNRLHYQHLHHST